MVQRTSRTMSAFGPHPSLQTSFLDGPSWQHGESKGKSTQQQTHLGVSHSFPGLMRTSLQERKRERFVRGVAWILTGATGEFNFNFKFCCHCSYHKIHNISQKHEEMIVERHHPPGHFLRFYDYLTNVLFDAYKGEISIKFVSVFVPIFVCIRIFTLYFIHWV